METLEAEGQDMIFVRYLRHIFPCSGRSRSIYGVISGMAGVILGIFGATLAISCVIFVISGVLLGIFGVRYI